MYVLMYNPTVVLAPCGELTTEPIFNWSEVTMTAGTPRKVAILGGNRIPFARSNKEYANASNQDMLTAAIDGLVARYGLQNEELGLVVAGAVLKHSRDFNLTRETVLGSALASSTPAFDLQLACGTGLAALVQVADAIALKPHRVRHRRRCGYYFRRPAGSQRQPPQDPH